uniref:Uncharacterized protein n=1 Tax=Romanomermis culicivorax TaxID=13658 RepID=A0A915IHI1_ROMCU
MEDQPIGRGLSSQPFSEKDRVHELFLQKDKDFDNMFLKLHHSSSKECVSLVVSLKCNEKFIPEKNRPKTSRKYRSHLGIHLTELGTSEANLKDAIEESSFDVKAKNAELNAHIENRNLTKHYLDYLLQFKEDILKDRSSKQQEQLNQIKAKIEQFEQKLGLRIILYQDLKRKDLKDKRCSNKEQTRGRLFSQIVCSNTVCNLEKKILAHDHPYYGAHSIFPTKSMGVPTTTMATLWLASHIVVKSSGDHPMANHFADGFWGFL